VRDRHAVVAEERKAGPFERWGQTRDAERAPEGKEGEGDAGEEGKRRAREKRTGDPRESAAGCRRGPVIAK